MYQFRASSAPGGVSIFFEFWDRWLPKILDQKWQLVHPLWAYELSAYETAFYGQLPAGATMLCQYARLAGTPGLLVPGHLQTPSQPLLRQVVIPTEKASGPPLRQ
jgi:hypothetical protein